MKAAIFGAREAFEETGRTLPIQTSVSLLPNGGKMLLGTDIQAVLTTLRGARRRRDRAQLLDRARGHARRDPLPRRDHARCRSTASPTPACPCRAPTARRSSPRSPSRWRRPSASSSSATASVSSAAAAAPRPSTSPRSPSGSRASVPGERPAAGPDRALLDDDLDRRWCRSRARPWSASGSTRRARRNAKELLLADDYDGIVQVAEDQVEGGAHVLDVCVALIERDDEDEQMSAVVKRISLTQPSPIQIDSTEPEVIESGARADPRPRDRQLDQPRGRPRQGRQGDPAGEGPRGGADRADDRRGRDGEDRRPQGRDRPAAEGDRLRRARPRAGGADLRRPHLHPDHRRRRVEALRGRDDRGHPPDQGRDPRGQDLARRLQRLLRRSRRGRGRSSTRSSSTTASRPGSTWRWSTRTTSRPTARSPRRSAS